MNVLINLDGIESDFEYIESMKVKVEKLISDSEKEHARIYKKTRQVIEK